MKEKIKMLFKNKKKLLIIVGLIIILCTSLLILFLTNKEKKVEESVEEVKDFYDTLYDEDEEDKDDDFIYDPSLPKPEILSGSRGELGIDKNINESTIDMYLGRDDSVYRDMRMLIDPAYYENIGGSRYLEGYIKGFEIVSLPYIIPVKSLPDEVGNTYSGNTLFHMVGDKYVANYYESLKIIEKLFPKNKYIFLMCGGGGYANMMKNFLVSMGWKSDRIYNVGGFWNYEGENAISTLESIGPGGVEYNFDNIPYHEIDFNRLTKSEDYVLPDYAVENVEISTSQIKLEEGISFQLNAIVLPNEAPNKAVKWSSDDESVATVSKDGLVKGIKKGVATITVKTKDGNKIATCSVLVVGVNGKEKVILDDVSEELKIFSENDPNEYERIFNEKNDELRKQGKDKTIDGFASPEWHKIYNEYSDNSASAINIRKQTFNKMMDEGKSFIVLINSKDCGSEGYRIIDGAEKLLTNSNIPHFYTYDGSDGIDTSFVDSKVDKDDINYAVVVIVKNGKIYSTLNREYDSIKSDEELKTWFSKYIDL